jgi:hypothetical protein
MNALQTLFAQLRVLIPDQAEELIATYRTNATADTSPLHRLVHACRRRPKLRLPHFPIFAEFQ